PILSNMRVSVTASYQILNLSHTIDGTGQITDTNPLTFSQQRSYADLGVIYGYSFARSPKGGTAWWVEGGLDFLWPLSAKQSSPLGDVSFTAKDKLLYATAGLGLSYPLAEALAVQSELRLNYNLFAGSGSRLFGIRLGIALGIAL